MSEEWEALCLHQLKTLQKQNGGTIDINQIDVVIKQFLNILSAHLTDDQEHILYNQIEQILTQFSSLKQDVSNLSHEVLADNFIPDMNTDLRDVVLQTETSVAKILDIADELGVMAQKINDSLIRGELIKKSTTILEVCNFQDLTGQRIQKIVHHLVEIESVVYKMLHALRPDLSLKKQYDSRTTLINGPQSTKNTPSQDDIDALFKDL